MKNKIYNFLNKNIFRKICAKYLLKEIGYDLERIEYILEQHQKIYLNLTKGRMSYLHYDADEVLYQHNNIIEEKYIEKDALDGLTKDKLLKFLKENDIKIRD